MKAIKFLLYGLTLAAFTFSSTAMASPEAHGEEHAVKSIAKILSHLNHFPSAAEKKTLKKISSDDNNPQHIQVIATALINMQHSVSAGDKSKLKSIANDQDVGDDARTLASILINFNHKPSKADRQKLEEILE